MALGGWPTETFVLKGHTVITGEDVVVVVGRSVLSDHYNFVVGRTENGTFAKSLNKGRKTDETKENNNQKEKKVKIKGGIFTHRLLGVVNTKRGAPGASSSQQCLFILKQKKLYTIPKDSFLSSSVK
jgi:hypothetical protein